MKQRGNSQFMIQFNSRYWVHHSIFPWYFWKTYGYDGQVSFWTYSVCKMSTCLVPSYCPSFFLHNVSLLSITVHHCHHCQMDCCIFCVGGLFLNPAVTLRCLKIPAKGRKFTFQHNDTKHTAKSVLEQIQNKSLNVLEWPSKSLTP